MRQLRPTASQRKHFIGVNDVGYCHGHGEDDGEDYVDDDGDCGGDDDGDDDGDDEVLSARCAAL